MCPSSLSKSFVCLFVPIQKSPFKLNTVTRLTLFKFKFLFCQVSDKWCRNPVFARPATACRMHVHFRIRSGLKRQHTELSKRARVLVQQVKRGRVPEDYPQLIVWRDQLNSLYNDALAKHQEHVGAFVLSPKGWKKADKWESDFRRDHQVIMAVILEALALQPQITPSSTSTPTTKRWRQRGFIWGSWRC